LSGSRSSARYVPCRIRFQNEMSFVVAPGAIAKPIVARLKLVWCK
jgi:hypothetical protein